MLGWDAVGFHPRKPCKKRSLGTSGDGCIKMGIQGRNKLKTAEMSQVLSEAMEEKGFKNQMRIYFKFLHHQKQQGWQHHRGQVRI